MTRETRIEWALLEPESIRRVTGKLRINRALICLTRTEDPIGNIEEFFEVPNRRHGMSHLPIYLNWQGMIQRCENPKHPKYPIYGARGIRVCARWKVFENFYADMGDRPSPHYSIDRIENDGNYEPGNCRWATKREQLLNTRRSIAKRARALGARIMSNFEMENTRRHLIALRVKYGATTQMGHACSNLIEQMQEMRTYVTPSWATDERQTLPWMMKQQMMQLARGERLN